MPRPCEQRHPEPMPEQCVVCRLYLTDAYHRAAWGGDGGAKAAERRATQRPPCVHLGQPTGERRECETCSGRVRLKLFACKHPAHPDPVALRDCKTCGDYASDSPKTRQS